MLLLVAYHRITQKNYEQLQFGHYWSILRA